MLSTALTHVELAERVLDGWTATEALPAIVGRADDRAEAAAAVARELLHTLHRGNFQNNLHDVGCPGANALSSAPSHAARSFLGPAARQRHLVSTFPRCSYWQHSGGTSAAAAAESVWRRNCGTDKAASVSSHQRH